MLTGTKKVQSESITCSSLKRERHYDSGYYILKDEFEPPTPKLGYCDMNNVDYIENGSSGPILGVYSQITTFATKRNIFLIFQDTGILHLNLAESSFLHTRIVAIR